MRENVFQFISDLENNIADFYSKMNSLSRFSSSRDIFIYMREHSQTHGFTVQSLEKKYPKPQLDNELVQKVHNQIKESLFEEIRNANEETNAIEKIARAEELVGKMYKMMAHHFADLSEYYKSIEFEINRIAGEEFEHRDMVLAEGIKYAGTRSGGQ